jgi:transposase
MSSSPNWAPSAASRSRRSRWTWPGYAKSALEHAPDATICIDNYHVVSLGNRALDEVRRDYWNELRKHDQEAAKGLRIIYRLV